MFQSSLICPVCNKEYDLENQVPRVIPDCGHTICSHCILQNLAASKWLQFHCPLDK